MQIIQSPVDISKGSVCWGFEATSLGVGEKERRHSLMGITELKSCFIVFLDEEEMGVFVGCGGKA